MADALQILGMSYKLKKKFIKSHKTNVQKRMLQQKKPTPLNNTNSAQKNKTMVTAAEHILNGGPIRTAT